nr:F-box protein CPR1-like isoform X2 [Coffea arabica]
MIDNFPTCLPWLETGAFVSGKLHWAVSSCVCDCDARVVSLDLVRLEYGEVQLPGCVEDASVLTLGVLGKCLCVSILYCDQPNVYSIWKKNVGLWVMMEYGVVESWIKVASVRPYHAPLCISAKGEILLTSSSDFGLYNLGDESMRYPRIEDVDDVYLEGHIYVESLVSPFADEERYMTSKDEYASTRNCGDGRPDGSTCAGLPKNDGNYPTSEANTMQGET